MELVDFLFSTREGVIVLVIAGVLICLIIAVILERKTRKQFFDHPEQD